MSITTCLELDEKIRALRTSVLASGRVGKRARGVRKRLQQAILERESQYGPPLRTGGSIGGDPRVLILEILHPGPETHRVILNGAVLNTVQVRDGHVHMGDDKGNYTVSYKIEGFNFFRDHERGFWLRVLSSMSVGATVG